ncbi:hypothetical protein FA014_19545, partial [Cellulomonas hominis]
LALALRATGGARYGGSRLPRAATPLRELRARAHEAPAPHAEHRTVSRAPADDPSPGRPSPAPRHLETA